MESKDGLEFGTKVTVYDEHATVHDLCKHNSAIIKVRMENGRFEGDVLIAVLSHVKLGWR